MRSQIAPFGPSVGEFTDVVRRRRMTRAFRSDPVAPEVLERLVDLASRAPSAGKTQGWDLVVMSGAQTARFWDVTLPAERRRTFRWAGLLDAPIVAVVLADPRAYVERYAEPDKATSRSDAGALGSGIEAWPAPYWTIDASMAVMTLLLAAHDVGLGALFFGVFHGEAELRVALGIPDGVQVLGAIALGTPVEPAAGSPAGRSATRSRRRPAEIIHRGRW